MSELLEDQKALAAGLIADGFQVPAVVDSLVKIGADRRIAEDFVLALAKERFRQQSAARMKANSGTAKLHMLSGLGIGGLGIAMTTCQFLRVADNPAGGSFVIFWGLILVGFFEFLYGWSTRKPI